MTHPHPPHTYHKYHALLDPSGRLVCCTNKIVVIFIVWGREGVHYSSGLLKLVMIISIGNQYMMKIIMVLMFLCNRSLDTIKESWWWLVIQPCWMIYLSKPFPIRLSHGNNQWLLTIYRVSQNKSLHVCINKLYT